jgi:hypothetical protein
MGATSVDSGGRTYGLIGGDGTTDQGYGTMSLGNEEQPFGQDVLGCAHAGEQLQ